MIGTMGAAAGVVLALVFLLASGGSTGEYHVGGSLVCYDCHTIHFSMQHGYQGEPGPVPTTPQAGGFWLGTGPNEYLLKAPVNQICSACHDGQTFAPDVVATNVNPSPSRGRSAGALNVESGAGSGAPYQAWKGHTLDSTATPPGFDPTKVGLSATWYNPANGLECTSCHLQHGQASRYRNLGPRALGAVTYKISTTFDSAFDVWINLASYSAGTGLSGTFNPYYDTLNINYRRNDATVGTTKSSNQMDVHCGACHGNFHGGPGDASIGGVPNPGGSGFVEFLRHPTAQVTIGQAGGGHSDLPQFVAGTTKAKVYTNDYTGYTNSSPGCVSCHKGHGNQNPFGLVFLGQQATSVTEEGGWNSGQTPSIEEGFRNLCGQCHRQGN